MHHAKTFLESKNLKYYFFLVDEDLLSYPDLLREYGLAINHLSFEEILKNHPKAMDNTHPGMEAHAKIAEVMYEQLLE